MTGHEKCVVGCGGSRVATVVLKMVKETKKAEKLPNKKLVDVVLEKVWGQYDVHSTESAVLGELIERFKEKTGVMAHKVSRVRKH